MSDGELQLFGAAAGMTESEKGGGGSAFSVVTPTRSLVLRAPATGVTVDRLMLMEEQADGQRVRAFSTEALVGGAWVALSSGASVGNKRIDVLPQPVTATAFRLNVTSAAAWPLTITNFAVFEPCPLE